MKFSARTAIPVTTLLALAVLALPACKDKDNKAAAVGAEAPLELLPVDVAVVRRGALAGGLPVTGGLQPVHQTTVQARVGSDIAAVLVREGERVQQGQVLARLGTQDLEARVKQAEAQLASAKVEAQLSRALVDRKAADVLVVQHDVANKHQTDLRGIIRRTRGGAAGRTGVGYCRWRSGNAGGFDICRGWRIV